MSRQQSRCPKGLGISQLRRSTIIGVAIVLLSIVSKPSAAQVTIDFDSLPVTTVITDQFDGVRFALLGSAPIDGPRTYALEDTLGNPVNIFGASGNAITPGDNIGGINPPFFDMELVFDPPIDHFSIMALDAEETLVVQGYLNGVLVQSVTKGPGTFVGDFSSPVFNGPVHRLELGSIGGTMRFDRVVLDLEEADGPELFDNLMFHSALSTVGLDIKPQSCPNPLNTKSKGVTPVAVLGASDFDVTQIDIASLRLEGVPAIRSSIEDVATPFSPTNGLDDALDCNDFGPDGFDDLTLKFNTQELIQALGDVQDGEVRVLKLTGVLLDDTPIEGQDVVVIKAKGGGNN